MKNRVLENVRRSLGKETDSLFQERPAIYPSRKPETVEQEMDSFIKEVKALSGTVHKLQPEDVAVTLQSLVNEKMIRKAATWNTPLIHEIGIERCLQTLGVEIVSPTANKYELAACDLGITEADALLPETGTLVLHSSNEMPRAVSLLPRIHLAIVRPDILQADLHEVFNEANQRNYLLLITGPSRTADIELTVTLGVHGPKELHVWMMVGEKEQGQ